MSQYKFALITEEISKLPFYITSIGYQLNQEHIDRPSGHPEYHWIHCVKGKGKVIIEGKEYIITENMGFFIKPNTQHDYFALQEPWETHWMTFMGYGIQPLLGIVNLDHSKPFYIQSIHLLEDIFFDMLNSQANSFDSSVLLYKFLILCRDCITTNNRMKLTKNKQLQPVITYINHHYQQNLTLDDLSNLLTITPHHLCRLFKEVYNLRPIAYVNKVRIQKAKELILLTDELQIKELSKHVGYNDVSYFCFLFKVYEGMTPTEFRKIHRKE